MPESTTPAPATRSRGTISYVPALDGLRGLAVLVVMAQHATWLAGGQVGVYLFFTLSGYLITSLLLAEHRAHGRVDMCRFYRRRALRLFPVLGALLVVGSAYVALAPDPVRGERTFDDSPWVLLYSANWARIFGEEGALGLYKHTWSLAVEEQFYIVWPLLLIAALALYARTRAVLLVAILGVVLSFVARFCVPYGDDSYARIYNGLDTQASYLLIGCALAALLQATAGNHDWRLGLRRALRVGFAPAVAVLALSIVLIPPETDNPTLRLLAILLTAACAVVVGYVSSQGGARVDALLSRPVLTEIGKRSYGLYVWHYPIFIVVSAMYDGSDWKRPLQFGLSFAAAWASYRWIEQPFLRRKDRSAPSDGRPKIVAPRVDVRFPRELPYTSLGR